jgi:GPI mannosyltransferase 3
MLWLDRVRDWFGSLDRVTRLAFLLAAALRIWLAFGDHSVFWPDEIYQSLEPAHRLAFGYGLLPWEFRDGARSWFFPALLAPVLWLLDLFGVRAGLAFVVMARLFMVSLSLVSIGAAIEYARRLAGRPAALLAAFPLALFTPLLVFSHRTLQETASAPFVTLVPLLFLSKTPKAARIAGILAGIACILRFQCVLLAGIFLLQLLFTRRVAEAKAYSIAGAGVALAAGLLDLVTWGTPFHSLVTYVRFNLVQGGASNFGVAPPWYFLTSLISSVGPAIWLVFAGFLLGAPRAWATAAACAVFVAAHSAIPHKELRFLLPVVPLLLSIAAAGLASVLARFRVPAWAPLALAILLGLGCIKGARAARYVDLGQYEGTKRADGSPWNTEEEPNLLLAEAGRQADACGVMMLGVRAAFTGGYSYLHRKVPLLYRHRACEEAKVANYLIAKTNNKNVPSAFTPLQSRGEYSLFRREGSCEPPPADYDDMLEGADDMGLGRAPIRQPDKRELRITAGGSAAAFVKGFSNGEHVECRTARWAVGTHSVLAFPLEPTGGAYTLTFGARPFWRTLPQTAAVTLNGQRLGNFELTDGWEGYQAAVPPSALRRGQNSLEFRFARTARPGTEDQRDLAVLFDQFTLAPIASELTIDFGSAEARQYLGQGFSGDENNGQRSFVWSDAKASDVKFTVGGAKVPHVLSLLASAYHRVAPVTVDLTLNGKASGSFEVPARWVQLGLMIPPGVVQPGVNTLVLAYRKTGIPKELEPPAVDTRDLAVMYDQLSIAALPEGELVDLGAAPARAHLLSGWSSDEREENRTFVWNDGPHSVLAMQAPNGGDGTRALRVKSEAFQPALPLHADVKINGRSVGKLEAQAAWSTAELPIPDDLMERHLLIEFTYSKFARPSDSIPGSKDRRPLSMRFDSVEIVEGVRQPETPE